ncbi:hypothetical protein [Methanocella conradii]|nr:hypothetical protein [Methanocella conradii]
MKIKLNRILCIPVSLMILLAVTVVPTMACSPLMIASIQKDGKDMFG